MIVIVSCFVFPAGMVKLEGFTVIEPPAGATVWTENDWFAPLTFRAVRVVTTCPDIVGALMLGVFAWIRLSGAAARAAYCAAVTSNVSVGRVARLARIDPAPGVERVGRRHAVRLEDVLDRRRHQRRLDLAGRPRRGGRP